MSLLRARFPADWPGWEIPEITLQHIHYDNPETQAATPGPTRTSIALSEENVIANVDAEVKSDYFSDSPIFVASLERRSLPVVLKFAMRDDLVSNLANEASIYLGPLASLQGSVVPKCHGFYIGSTRDNQTIACLMLEHCGQTIRKRFSQLPLDQRTGILEKLGKIHQRGIIHGDFAERNVLDKDGEIKIIDFDKSDPHHQCGCKMDFCAASKPPTRESFGCDALWELCLNGMRLWGE